LLRLPLCDILLLDFFGSVPPPGAGMPDEGVGAACVDDDDLLDLDDDDLPEEKVDSLDCGGPAAELSLSMDRSRTPLASGFLFAPLAKELLLLLMLLEEEALHGMDVCALPPLRPSSLGSDDCGVCVGDASFFEVFLPNILCALGLGGASAPAAEAAAASSLPLDLDEEPLPLLPDLSLWKSLNLSNIDESFFGAEAAPGAVGEVGAAAVLDEEEAEEARTGGGGPVRLLLDEAHELVELAACRRLPGAESEREEDPRPKVPGAGIPDVSGLGEADLDPVLGSRSPLLAPAKQREQSAKWTQRSRFQMNYSNSTACFVHNNVHQDCALEFIRAHRVQASDERSLTQR
jgi:hypothetical protein